MSETRNAVLGMGNHTQEECFKCQFQKMEVLQFFSKLNQAFSFRKVFWDSKLIRHGNLGKLDPFQTKKNKDRSKKVTYSLFPLGPSFVSICHSLETLK